MVAKDFCNGDLVWAKMKGYPFWPGKIIKPPLGPKPKKNQHYVHFFGSENNAWILDENITHHSVEMVPTSMKKKPSHFQEAIDIILHESKKQPKKVKSLLVFNEKHDEESGSPSLPKNVNNKISKVQRRHSSSSDSEKMKETPKKRKRAHSELDDFNSVEENCNSPSSTAVANEFSNGVAQNMWQSTNFPKSIASSHKKSSPSSPNLDFDISAILHKPEDPTKLKVGFLGLGNMGQGLVRNLLKSGHHVTVWNRTLDKCDDFINEGANHAETPAAVVSQCQVTFSCVSDPDACKSVVFGKYGVLEGLEMCGEEKGYIEMTTIDPQTSQAIAEGIIGKGGTYLEAHMNGTRKSAEDGTLFLLLAGDRDLFAKCRDCFKAMSKKAYYIGRTVGTGSQMNLILCMLEGVIYAALGEAMALTDRLSLSQHDFVEVLELSSLNCAALKEKGKAIVNKDYTANMALKHVQKDMNMAISMGSSCDQSTPLAAAANEMYKHAKLLRYGDKDVCAVYKGSKI